MRARIHWSASAVLVVALLGQAPVASGAEHRAGGDAVASADGAGIGAAWSPSASARSIYTKPYDPFPNWERLIDRQYSDLLGRGPTGAERTPWLNRLAAGTHHAGDLVQALRVLPEHAGIVDPVVRLYQAYFLRRPDRDGLVYWVAQRRGGRSLQSISSAFAASPEFRSLYGSLTNRGFVELIYQNILGRPGEAAGITYWTGEIDSRRKNRGQVMVGFSESPEYRNGQASEVTASVLPILMLERTPRKAEHDALVAYLDANPGGAAMTALSILRSAEYEARINTA